MFNKVLKKMFGSNEEKAQTISGTFIVIQLNEKIMPIDRGEFYEDPLDEFLRVNN